MKKKNSTKNSTAKKKVVKKVIDNKEVEDTKETAAKEIKKATDEVIRKTISKEKKSSNAFIWIIAIVLLAIFLSAAYLSMNKKTGYTEINYTELKEKLDKKESFVLFVGKETCSACASYKEILNIQNKYGKLTFYIDLEKLSDEEKASFNSKFDFSATPTTFIIKDGEHNNIDKVTGSDGYDIVVSIMKKKGLIK